MPVAAESVNMLNPALEVPALREAFAQRGRIRVPDILETGFAEQAARLLETEIPWRVAFRRDREAVSMTQEEFAALNPTQQQQMLAGILDQAGSTFQYLYNHYNLADAYRDFPGEDHFLFRLVEFMASEHFLGFARSVTRVESIRRISVQATRYVRGQFLTRHDDTEDPDREVAFVLGLTRHWSPGWGGILQITDESGDILESYVPRFNSLIMFRVPLLHCVSYVAPFAQAPRHSLTGWFTR